MQPYPFPNFFNKKKTLKKRKIQKKKNYRFDRKKRISDSDCTAKNAWYKKIRPFILYVIKGKYYRITYYEEMQI